MTRSRVDVSVTGAPCTGVASPGAISTGSLAVGGAVFGSGSWGVDASAGSLKPGSEELGAGACLLCMCAFPWLGSAAQADLRPFAQVGQLVLEQGGLELRDLVAGPVEDRLGGAGAR